MFRVGVTLVLAGWVAGLGEIRFVTGQISRGKLEPINQPSWALWGFNVIYMVETFGWNRY